MPVYCYYYKSGGVSSCLVSVEKSLVLGYVTNLASVSVAFNKFFPLQMLSYRLAAPQWFVIAGLTYVQLLLER